jgi:hypothetical protein
MAEYEIQPLSWRCALTGRQLKPGEVYYSVLSDSPEGFVRMDYSSEAWTGPPAASVGFWRAQVPKHSERKQAAAIDDSAVMEFFVRLAGEPDDYKRNFRYILALLLMRKRILKCAGVERQGDVEILILREPATGTEHRLVDPQLSETELATVQAEVERVLLIPKE